jgi:microcystin degradation protein MlrC
MELKECGNVVEPSLDSVLSRIKVLLEEGGSGPILLVEPSDNIGGGAPGDDSTILRALIEYGIPNAAVVINDPAAVEAVGHLPIGTHLRLPIGDKSGIPSGGPLNLEVELISTSDGRFELEDAHSHLASMAGRHIAMGPCAVIRYGGIRILLTSHKTPPFDLGQLRSQGIEPQSLSVIGIKAAVAHRRAYDPIARATFTVSTPGPCHSDLQALPYNFIRRPVYPLDSL